MRLAIRGCARSLWFGRGPRRPCPPSLTFPRGHRSRRPPAVRFAFSSHRLNHTGSGWARNLPQVVQLSHTQKAAGDTPRTQDPRSHGCAAAFKHAHPALPPSSHGPSSCKSSARPRSPKSSLESPLAGSWGSP